MSVQTLIDDIDNDNLAEGMDTDKLRRIGDDVVTRFDEDWQSMKDWRHVIDEGLLAIDQDGKPKSDPFDNAANYKSTIIPEAAIKFGDRVTMEILNHRDLVKGDVIGRDPNNQKQEKMDRVSEYMNYDINHKMPDWRGGQEKIAYRIPLIGSMFKKTAFNPLKGCNDSIVIDYPNFAVNMETEDDESRRSFTHILEVNKAGVQMRVNAGIWIDREIYSEDAASDEGSNAKKGTSTEDNDDRFLEQHCYCDLHDDGLAIPVIVTVHEKSKEVVRIVPDYSEYTIYVKHETRVESVSKAIERQRQAAQMQSNDKFEPNYSTMKLTNIVPASQITHYRFLRSIDGTYLGIGYFHELANLQKAHNMATNQLLDAGTLNNLGGGFLAKGFRKKMGMVRVKPSEWKTVDIDPALLKNGILPLPTKEPSPTLYNLKENLSTEMRNFTVVAGDEASQIQGNTAPTTALAILFEAGQATSALLLRFTRAMGEEFRKLFYLSKLYIDPLEYQQVLDDENASFEADFNNELFDIVPVANPEMSSRMQRIQLATVELEQFDRVLQTGGNPIAILKNFYDVIGTDYVDQIFPEEGAMTPAEKQQLEQMTQAQEMANQQMQIQIQLLQQQVLNDKKEADSLAVKRIAEIEQILAKIGEIKANTILLAEKAESEELNNQINKYTASMQAIQDSLTAILPGQGLPTQETLQ